MKALSKKDFDKMINKKENAIVDFWAPWCMPCSKMTTVMDEIEAKYKNKLSFYKVNVDDESELTSTNAVMNIPTIIYFCDGKAKDRTIGVVSKEEIEKKISEIY